MQPRRLAAWHAYLVIATELLPSVRAAATAASEQFAALSVHLAAGRRWWGGDGERMSAILARAEAMHHRGDRAGAAVLLRVLAVRLFAISSTMPTASCDGGEPQ